MTHDAPPTLAETRWIDSRRLFLAGLGVVYLAAFGSLWWQVEGLYGSAGIRPVAEVMAYVAENYTGLDRLSVPTLLWFGASDAALSGLCLAGAAGSVLLIAGVWPRVLCAALWAGYLSFVTVGYPFLPFQWDALLLEAGLLAVLYAPGGVLAFRRPQREPSRIFRFLLAWLLFRLMFQSGLVKLQSGDEVWRDLTALQYHYWTQPIPHRVSHFAHHLPAAFGKACVLAMFAIELVAPFLVFGPRRVRQFGLAAIGFLMVVIAATGNYGFFNVLTVVLCLPLLDDRAVRRWLPFWPAGELEDRAPDARRVPRTLRSIGAYGLAAFVVLATSASARWLPELPAPIDRALRTTGRTVSFNSYGLFADMTEMRPEIRIEGSEDGVTWRTYRFEWKPGDTDRAPGFAAVHMPRLDWQMWFAALRGAPPDWFGGFLLRLFEASPPVLALLEEDPFDGRPPRYLRTTLHRYAFGTPEQRRQGTWWTSEYVRAFGPTLERGANGEIRAAREP